MKTIFLGKNCIELEEVDSTNSYLADLTSGDLTPATSSPALFPREKGETAVFEGTVVVAKNQVRGRGQRGNNWESEAGKNLIISILLNPSFLAVEEQFQLNKAVSLGVSEFVLAVNSPFEGGALTEALRVSRAGDVRIKWPNDIYIGNKKVAGILIENSVSGSKLQQSIVGIGINVNQVKFPAHLPNPTSLKLAVGKEFDLKECLEQLCSCIEKRYLELRAGHVNRIDADYLKSMYRLGEFASYHFMGSTLRAKITGVAKIGELLLETEKGERLECDFSAIKFSPF